MLELSATDHDLAMRLALALGTSRSEILRWALRYYVHAGPWTTDDPAAGDGIRALAAGMVIGPQRAGGAA